MHPGKMLFVVFLLWLIALCKKDKRFGQGASGVVHRMMPGLKAQNVSTEASCVGQCITCNAENFGFLCAFVWRFLDLEGGTEIQQKTLICDLPKLSVARGEKKLDAINVLHGDAELFPWQPSGILLDDCAVTSFTVLKMCKKHDTLYYVHYQPK